MQQQEDFVLDTPARMKAVSHPLRLGILRCLRDQELTNKELADALDVEAGKLHFHTKKLLEAGLIELAGTRQNSAIVEKLYRSRVRSFTQPPGDGVNAPKLWDILQEGMHLYEVTWRESGEPYHYGGQYIQYHSEETEQELVRELQALMDRFHTIAVGPDAPGARALSFTTLLHRLKPVASRPTMTDDKEKNDSS
jgi:DNA-binding transcriptional ArsR family regulator